eukprot:CAMPEP_0185269746 /NCGR_PEP_ID=MMETSP1359-20130426/40690_1 /TAXON_ID=552665 /ORGANISM="Bigelowiella longifila, Strain CCMP242" /LENGTH=191 /DNA_ID=CAMNT_0027861057 /DNA_START=108 /DNA_END=683 /DNA_ORIENTATION=+
MKLSALVLIGTVLRHSDPEDTYFLFTGIANFVPLIMDHISTHGLLRTVALSVFSQVLGEKYAMQFIIASTERIEAVCVCLAKTFDNLWLLPGGGGATQNESNYHRHHSPSSVGPIKRMAFACLLDAYESMTSEALPLDVIASVRKHVPKTLVSQKLLIELLKIYPEEVERIHRLSKRMGLSVLHNEALFSP